MRGGKAVGLVLLLVVMAPGCRRRAAVPAPAPEKVAVAAPETPPAETPRPATVRRMAGGMRLAPVPEPEPEAPVRPPPKRVDSQPSNVSRSGMAPPSLSEPVTGRMPLWRERAKHY